MKVYSFPRGGFLYEDPTSPVKSQVANAFLPALSVISLGNKEKPVYPVVSIGENVREGMLIGRASGAGTANVHATVPGKIFKKISWIDKNNINNDALVIKMEGAFDKLGRREDILIWNGLNCYDLQKIISDYGIVEMENDEKPLSDIISAARKKDKLTLVVRCVFDDPWLVADYVLCRDRISSVIEGAAITAKACQKVTQIVFAVSHHEHELGQQLLSAAGSLELPSSLVLTGSRYPQRNSRELKLALRTYERKENVDLGELLILGPSVLAAVSDAVAHKRPILDRYVAVGGSAVYKPQIMKIRIGTRIGDVIEQCGGFIEAPEKILTGSPLSGKEVRYLDEPVGKSCYAIVAMAKSQTAVHSQWNCINCGECRVVCPMGLDPQSIYKSLKLREIESPEHKGCHGCGCCKVFCPSALPLLETILESNKETESA